MIAFDRAEAESLFRRLRDDRASADAERDRLATVVSALDNMMAGLVQIFPDLGDPAPQKPTLNGGDSADAQSDPSSARGDRPNSVDAVASVVNELASDEPLTVPMIVRELDKRGWLPVAKDPVAAIRTALNRASKRGLVEVVPIDRRSNGFIAPGRSATPATNASGPALAGPEDSLTTTGAGGDPHAQTDQDHGQSLAGRNRDDRGGATVGDIT